MFRSINIILVSVLMFGSFFSCQTESTVPDQNKIYTSYVFNYNASINKTTAEVAFYLDGLNGSTTQKLELEHSSQVTFNDKVLLFNVNDRCYRKEFINLTEGAFKYTNHDGITYMNTVEMTDSISILASSDSADAQYNYHFEIEGAPLNENEVVEVEITSLASGYDLTATFTNIGFSSVVISTDQLAALGSGKAVIKATRKTVISENLQTPEIGGSISSEYAVQDTVVIY